MSDNGKITWVTETRRLGDLEPWPENPRQLTKDQAKRLEHSLTKFGYSQLVEIEPDGTFLDGHQRDELMKVMDDYGADAQIEVRVASRKFTLEERKEYIAQKHQGATGEWDWDGMHNLYTVDELMDFGFDADELEIHGFEFEEDEPEDDPGAQIDRAEELREKWGVESGQLWQLGEHRLICGDCTDAEVVKRLMDGERAGAVVTDPPYNVDYNYDDEFDDNIENYGAWLVDWLMVVSNYIDDGWLIVKNIPRNLFELQSALEGVGEYKNTIVWPHSTGAIPSNRFVPSWECLAVYSKGNTVFNNKAETIERKTPDFLGGGINPEGRINEIWEDIKHVSAGSRKSKEAILQDGTNAKIHHAQMPEGLAARAIAFCTNEMDIIIDVFLGSGTTLIACERLGRKCRAVEISPAYCAVAIQRWVDMTSGEPELVEG